MAENYELNVNVDGVNECIDALDSAKDILDGCQADVDDKVALINCLPHGNAGNLILSVEPFDALDISNLQYQLHSVLDQIEDYNRANSSGEGNWFSNLFGGIAQGGVGVLEGIADGFASIVLDIGDACNVSGEWENGLANWIKEDWSYKAGYAVGNGLSGGKGYDENSGWAVAGKITGTIVTYGAISCIPGFGGVVADVAIGGLSGYGQGTQKALRKQGIQTESEWSNTLNNETVGRSDAVSKKAVSNSKGTATVEAFKGAGTALLANGLFKLGGKAISKVKGKGVSATSGLDDAASAVSKADDAANAADDAASAVSKADDTFRESGQKLVDAQTKLDEGYKSGMSESELGKLEEARDAAKREFSDAGGDSQELMNAASEKVNASRKLQELGDSKISQLLEKTDGTAKSASKSADDVAGAAGDSASKSLFRKLINKDSVILTIADKATSRKVDFPTTSNDSKSNTSTSSPETTSPTTSSPETTSPTTSSPKTTSPTTTQPAPTSTASQPAPAPTASQPAPTSAASQPTPTSTTSQTTAPPSTTSTTAPPSTPSTTASSTTSTPITTSSVTAAPSIVSKNSSTIHTGGRYSGTGGYTGTGDYTGTNSETGITNGVTDDISDKTSVLDDNITSIEDVIKGSNYTKIPTSSKPVITTSSSRTSAAIPISAAASAAAAAGIGAKAYLDRKNNNDNGSSDEINTDEWTGDDAVDIQYDDSSDTNAGENVLDADDDYSYQPAEDTEKYDARSSDELADLQ